MPEMSGIDLAIAIRRDVPTSKVLLFSGHVDALELTQQAMGTAQPSARQSVLRWLRDVVDHEVGHGLVHSFELEPKLFLHRGEDRGPAFGIVCGPFAAKLKRVIVSAG